MTEPPGNMLVGQTAPRGGHRGGLLQAMAKSTVQTIRSQPGAVVVRGVLDSILGSGKRRR